MAPTGATPRHVGNRRVDAAITLRPSLRSRHRARTSNRPDRCTRGARGHPCDRTDDHETGRSFVHQVVRAAERRADTRLFPTDRLAEVDEPDLAPRWIHPSSCSVCSLRAYAPLLCRIMHPNRSGGPRIQTRTHRSIVAVPMRLGHRPPPRSSPGRPTPPARRAAHEFRD